MHIAGWGGGSCLGAPLCHIMKPDVLDGVDLPGGWIQLLMFLLARRWEWNLHVQTGGSVYLMLLAWASSEPLAGSWLAMNLPWG